MSSRDDYEGTADFPEKQKPKGQIANERTCLGFWEEDAIKIKTDIPNEESFYYNSYSTETFPAVPKSEFDKLMKKHAELSYKMTKAYKTIMNDDRISKSEFDKMMESCHKLEVKYNELIQYSAKQSTDLVNSIPKEKVKKEKEELIKKIKAIYYFESVGVEDGNCISTKGQKKIDEKIKQLFLSEDLRVGEKMKKFKKDLILERYTKPKKSIWSGMTRW